LDQGGVMQGWLNPEARMQWQSPKPEPQASQADATPVITSPAADPKRFIAALARDQVCLDIKNIDFCFLAALHLRAQRSALASFEEDMLIDIFEQVCELVEPGAENTRKRATAAIQRLRQQRLFARVDSAGIVRTGEYALTRLAAAVVDYFLADEVLTRESLTLLTGTLRAQLLDILSCARRAVTQQDWQASVCSPLQVTVTDLIAGIDRRQRGLDTQQQGIQARIAQLLSAQWFSAIDQCQELLEETSLTLRELQDILLREAIHLLALLQDIQTEAEHAENTVAQENAQRLIEHIDRIGLWGTQRLKAWSEYYQYVHRYLQDVVRLDPERALSQRLRDQLASWPAQPFHLVVACAPAIRLLRPMARPAADLSPGMRPSAMRDQEPAWIEPEDEPLDIAVLVATALGAGACTLAQVTEHILADLPQDKHYLAAGRIAEELARQVKVCGTHERPWVAVSDGLELEDWSVTKERPP